MPAAASASLRPMAAPTTSPLLTESILETILATAPVGLGILDRELRFVRVNEALAVGNGVPRDRHLGRRIDEVWPTIPPDLLRRLGELVEGGEPVVDDQTYSEQDGRPRHVLGSYYPVRDEDGAVLGIGVVVADITARHLAEEALRSSERR